jgi:hypothetical protein
MKSFIKSEFELLRQRLSETASEWRAFSIRSISPWRFVVVGLVIALWIYVGYYSPIVIDLPYWVRYGSFPRR